MIRLLNLRHLRRQPLRAALAALAVAAATSMALGVFISYVSINTSFDRLTGQVYAHAPLGVVGAEAHGGIDERVVPKVAAVPGVRAAVPIIQTVAMALGPHLSEPVLALGVDCSIQAIVGDFGCSPSQIAASGSESTPLTSSILRAQAGPDGSLRTDTGVLPLGSAPALGALDRLNHGRVVLFPLPQAQRLFLRQGRIDSIAIVPSARVGLAALRSRLRSVIPPQDSLITSNTEASAVTSSVGAEMPLLILVALGTLSLGATLMVNVMTLALEERRRELAVTGALGATGRRVRNGALLEAAIIGAVGGLVGTFLAMGVAAFFLSTFSGISERIFGAVLTLHVPAVAFVLGIGGGALVAAVGALGPARKATKVSLTAELHQRGTPLAEPPAVRVRTCLANVAVGLIGLALGWTTRFDGGIHPWQIPAAYLGVLLTSAGLFGAIVQGAPFLVTGIRRILERTGHLSGSVWLAMANMARQPRRSGTMAVAVASAVGFGAGLASFFPATQASLTRTYDRLASGRVYVSPLGIINTATIDSKLDPAAVSRLARVPGVARIDANYYALSFSDGGRTVLTLHAIEGRDYGFRVFRGGIPREVLGHGEAMIGPGLAREWHLGVGSPLRLSTVHGPTSVRVGGIWEDADDSGATATVSVPLLQRLYGPLPPTEVWAQTAPGVSTSVLASRIRAARLGSDVRVYTASQYSAATVAGIGVFIAPFWVLQRMLLGVSFVATVSTLFLIGVQRRREQAMLGAVGLSRRALAKMVLAEGLIVGLIGAVLGVVAGLGVTLAMGLAGGVLFGTTAPFELAPLQILLYLVIGLLLVGLAATWPARRTSRLSVAEALRYE